MRRRDLMFASLAACATTASGAEATPGPVVLELFTSQACSSCPPADALLTELARTYRAMGFGYVKADFLFAGAMPGLRYDPSATGVEGYRRGLAALREGLGEDALLLGCGAPLLPSVGLVDCMRVSPDLATTWTHPDEGDKPSLRVAVRSDLNRLWTGGRWWASDPDCATKQVAARLSASWPSISVWPSSEFGTSTPS